MPSYSQFEAENIIARNIRSTSFKPEEKRRERSRKVKFVDGLNRRQQKEKKQQCHK
jgi:hypothetical protein